jgi:two-component system, LytTR family, response regulator
MREYTAIIIDDEKNAAESLKLQLINTGIINVVGIFNKPEIAITKIRDINPDLIFLDVQMPKINGIETAELLQQQVPCLFIFTTGHKDFAFESFRFHTIDYLLKPVLFPRLMQAITKALHTLNKEPGNIETAHNEIPEYVTVEVIDKENPINIALHDIAYLSSNKNYVRIWLNNGLCHKTRLTLKIIEGLLPSKNFLRVHRGYIVRITAIKSFTSNKISFHTTKQLIPTSRTLRQKINEALLHINKLV